jgi:hypothetical protein
LTVTKRGEERRRGEGWGEKRREEGWGEKRRGEKRRVRSEARRVMAVIRMKKQLFVHFL